MPQIKRLTKRAQRCLLAGIAFFGCLLLVEGGLRTCGFIPHPERRLYIHRYPDETEPFRDSFSRLAPDDTRPVVLCLGDSFTYGMGVKREDTYPGQLEKLFGGTLNVINAGLLGSGPISQKKCLLERLPFQPRLVILGALINDATDAEREAGKGKKKGTDPGKPKEDRIATWLRSNTATYPFLHTLRKRVQGIPYPFEHRSMTWEKLKAQKFQHYNSALDRQSWKNLVFPVWLEMYQECQTRGIDLMIVVFPVDVQLWESSAEMHQVLEAQRRIKAFADASQIPICDVTGRFRKAVQSGELRLIYSEYDTRHYQADLFTMTAPALYLHDGHPSPFAYKIAADEIKQTLEDAALLE